MVKSQQEWKDKIQWLLEKWLYPNVPLCWRYQRIFFFCGHLFLLVFKSHSLQKQTPLHLTLFEKYPENLKTVTNTGQKKKSQVSIGRKENLSNLARKNLFSAPFPSLQMPPLDFIYALHVVFVWERGFRPSDPAISFRISEWFFCNEVTLDCHLP